uniref:MGDG_synth n=1 Tax=uncultured Thermincola sp. TaxID=374807 RepID=A0A060CJR6_9FIRM|nr:MGDG_synth [uncultured Thermincola sp.]
MLQNFLHAFLAKRLKSHLLAYAPDVVVCTHATPAGVMQYFRDHDHILFPSVSVITDFTVHQMWLHKDTGQYFVANEELIEN